ncbi:olfactory receptor 11L1-like [Aquarana catesbeiana]|uniref:olfactory receptor 11L1-like n=1 Tax=Aquarana catesbeiana TaxID=8400 RepID=UPI003CC9D8C9
MDELNVTRITTIHLLGFQTPQNIKYLVFFILLMIYCVSVCGNLLIITLVSYSKSLHSPMYFFLSQLSVSDILLITDILPNTLHTVLVEETIISFSGCIVQFYFFAVAGTLQCLLLTVMSYDRYLAICKPLHYTLIMNPRLCWIMIITSWTLIIFVVLINTFTIAMLQFCGPNIINHFFCDLNPILKISCSDTTIIQPVFTTLSAIFVVTPFFIIIISYVYIIITIFEIPSITGRQKVFSTCSSHLTVVFIYFGTLFCVYLVPRRGQLWNNSKFLSLFYTVVTPLMNPIIYSLRNKDFKEVVGKYINLSTNSVQH